jgi:hypothetical protein
MYAEYVVVRVARLRVVERPFDGSSDVMRAPRIGDVGTIVNVLAPNAFVVECVDRDGMTVWLADFYADELDPVETERS